MNRLIISFILLGVGLISCKEKEEGSPERTQSKAVSYAEGFDLGQEEDISLIYLFQGNSDTLTYALYKDEEDKAKASLLGIPLKYPIKEFVVLSSPYTAMLESLNARNSIQAIANKDFIYSPELIEKVVKGEVAEVGSESILDEESTAKLGADLLLYSASPGMKQRKFAQLEALGLNCFPLSEWLELNLLGRAEWIKVIGLLLDKAAEADSLFLEVEKEYMIQLKALQALEQKPTVISSMPFKGVWYVPGGNSYMARIIKDAGGSYAWRDREETGSVPLAFEAVYPLGVQADIWLSPGSVKTYGELIARDERFVDFLPYQNKKIYHNYKRSNENGGNDYWESAVVRPHIILKDLIHIFHPHILPDHQSVYFAPLKE
ncbi:MAG: ABC transporter substrate-binding protein [Bacteroidota bacterium]